MTNERLDVLDGLRGFAILLVVWYHARLVSGQSFGPFDPIVQAGYLGVDLFFFVSGFCLFYPYAKCARDGKPQPSTRRFFQRRLLKIVPSYLLALFTFAALYHAQFGTFSNLAMHVAAHLAFVHTLLPATFGSISGPLWTIGVEVQFYLIFPLIVPWFRRSPLLGYAALFVLAETYRLAIGAFAPAPSFWWINQLPAFVDVFGAGMLAAYVIGGIHHQRTWDPLAATLFSSGTFALALAGLHHGHHGVRVVAGRSSSLVAQRAPLYVRSAVHRARGAGIFCVGTLAQVRSAAGTSDALGDFLQLVSLAFGDHGVGSQHRLTGGGHDSDRAAARTGRSGHDHLSLRASDP